MAEDQESGAKGYVAYTPREGVWMFTRSDTPERAMDRLEEAIVWRRVLCHPIDNPISAVEVD